MGKKYMGTNRTTFLINEKGIIYLNFHKNKCLYISLNSSHI